MTTLAEVTETGAIVPIVFGLLVAVVVLVNMVMFARRFIRCPAGKALVVTGKTPTGKPQVVTRGAVCCVVVLLSGAARAGDDPAERFEKVVKRMVQAIRTEDYAGLQQDFGKAMRDSLPPDKAKPFFQGLANQCGKVRKLDPPRLVLPDQAIFPLHFERAVLDVKVVLDGNDKITGLWFLPHAPPVPVRDRHASVLRLPFDGEWLVMWGGDTAEQNQHHGVMNQRHGFDFVICDKAGLTRKGNGTRNEDYFAFDRPVLCPGDGVVTDVIGGVRDNVPGSMNPYSALGNAVVIQHRENEVSVLAHFRLGSIVVKVGDRVKSGQVLGTCGNSGNSSEPHIHYHLQNTPVIQDGVGIKCIFDGVRVKHDAKSEPREKYSPVKGDVVGPQ